MLTFHGSTQIGILVRMPTRFALTRQRRHALFRRTLGSGLGLSVLHALPAADAHSLKKPCKVELYSDSKYVINSISLGWAKKWKENNWIKSDKKKALNIDLWDRLLNLLDIYDVSCHWVKGHSTNYYNNRCDEMAVQERLKLE